MAARKVRLARPRYPLAILMIRLCFLDANVLFVVLCGNGDGDGDEDGNGDLRVIVEDVAGRNVGLYLYLWRGMDAMWRFRDVRELKDV